MVDIPISRFDVIANCSGSPRTLRSSRGTYWRCGSTTEHECTQFLVRIRGLVFDEFSKACRGSNPKREEHASDVTHTSRLPVFGASAVKRMVLLQAAFVA